MSCMHMSPCKCTISYMLHSLGLGATYVPHHKAVGFAAAIDERLKKRLESGSKRKAAQRLEEDGADAATQGQVSGTTHGACGMKGMGHTGSGLCHPAHQKCGHTGACHVNSMAL
eukprot:1159660-Pelagomonas_calceolata.AAC.4